MWSMVTRTAGRPVKMMRPSSDAKLRAAMRAARYEVGVVLIENRFEGSARVLGPMEGSAMAMRVDGVVSEGLRFGSVVSDAAGNFGGREIVRSRRCCGGVRCSVGPVIHSRRMMGMR